MKLAAIYNVWDGTELLKGSIDCLKDSVDEIIIVYQKESNFGEFFDPWSECDLKGNPKISRHLYSPLETLGGTRNETAKRNVGLDIARDKNCTHFLHIDCDEYYRNFAEAKELYINSGCNGSVCSIYTYFKQPTLRFKKAEDYYVPFIHKLDPHVRAGAMIALYPFHVDPTRRINEMDTIELPVYMHHYSWVRKDIERKVRNSSARGNIQKCNWREDYQNAAAGIYVKEFQQELIEEENFFGIKIFC
jgi:hypothetical protein